MIKPRITPKSAARSSADHTLVDWLARLEANDIRSAAGRAVYAEAKNAGRIVELSQARRLIWRTVR